MLNKTDSFGGDTSYPPRFECQKYSGKMVPIYYISVHDKINNTKKNNFFKRENIVLYFVE